MTFNGFFDAVFCINLDSRPDRREHAQSQFEKHGIDGVQWFDAYPQSVGFTAVQGCNSSHRDILAVLAFHRINRALILEDDFVIIHEDFNERFSDMITMVPTDWDIIYIGGQYQNAPLEQLNESVVRCDGMLTTSSYAITGAYARWLIPNLKFSRDPFDACLSAFAKERKHYALKPRLMAQINNFSNIEGMPTRNYGYMIDQEK